MVTGEPALTVEAANDRASHGWRWPALLHILPAGGLVRLAAMFSPVWLDDEGERRGYPSQGYVDGQLFFVFGITQPALMWMDAPERSAARPPRGSPGGRRRSWA